MKATELERLLDKVDTMLDNERLKPKDEDVLIEVRGTIMQHLESGILESKELDKAIKKYKRLI